MIIAAICGYQFGYPIVQENRVHKGQQATFRGILVAGICYLLFGIVMVVYFLPELVTVSVSLTEIIETLLIYVAGVVAGLLFLFPIIFWGQFFVLIVCGALAGWLLYVYKSNQNKLILIGSLVVLPIGTFFLWSIPDPNQLPIYPDSAQVEYSPYSITESGTAEEKTITFTTPDSYKTVLGFYEQKLVNEGWYLLSQQENTLWFKHPSDQYRVEITGSSFNGGGQIRIRLKHSILFAFP